MSQEKVDQYKEKKANRKAIIEQERRKNNRMKWIASVVCAVVLVWVAFSVYKVCIDALPREQIIVDYTAIDTSLYYFLYE